MKWILDLFKLRRKSTWIKPKIIVTVIRLKCYESIGVDRRVENGVVIAKYGKYAIIRFPPMHAENARKVIAELLERGCYIWCVEVYGKWQRILHTQRSAH